MKKQAEPSNVNNNTNNVNVKVHVQQPKITETKKEANWIIKAIVVAVIGVVVSAVSYGVKNYLENNNKVITPAVIDDKSSNAIETEIKK